MKLDSSRQQVLSLYDRNQKLVWIGLNGLLVGLWLWLFHPVFPYLGKIFGREEFRLNQVFLVGAVVLIALQVRKGAFHPRLDQSPQFHLPSLALLLGGSVVFLISERYLNVNTLSASLFGLASYGMLGLWMRPITWQRGFPAALLLIGVLPFGDHLQTFIGYPARLMTAAIVRDGLARLGVDSVGMDTILVFENGLSKIDLPCSGVKSLWTGGLFLLASTWIERRRINLRWLAVAGIFVLLLFTVNLARVAILVSIGQVAGWRLLAEMLHVPLGVLGFASACLAAVAMLRRQPESPTEANPSPGLENAPHLPTPRRPAWLPGALVISLLIMIWLYTPPVKPALAHFKEGIRFPPEMGAELWPLPDQVLDWLNLDGPVSARRWRFNWHGEAGSILIVANNNWRASHHPERCFQAYGMTILSQSTVLLAPDFPANLISLQSGQPGELLSAVYWLQSRDQLTEDFAARVWAEIIPNHQPWVQVTLLFDETIDPRSADSLALFTALRQTVQHSMEVEGSP